MEWKQAIAVLQLLKSEHGELDIITYNAVLSACQKSAQWQRALLFFAELQEQGLEPTIITCDLPFLLLVSCSLCFGMPQMQCLSTFLGKCFYVFVICLPYIGLRQRVHQCLWRVWSVDPSVIPALTGRVHRPSNDDELRLMCLKNCWDLCSLFSSSLNQKTQDEVISWVYIYIYVLCRDFRCTFWDTSS